MSRLEGILPICEGGQGHVFDFVCESGVTLITDYHCLDKKIISEKSAVVKISGKQDRIEITSIEKLKSALNEFVATSIKILCDYTPFDPSNPYTLLDFSDLTKSLLVEQIVFDILFDKYLTESELMTRNSYSNYMGKLLSNDSIQSIRYSRAFNERIMRGMSTYHDRTAYSKLPEQIKMLGVNPEVYAEYYNPYIRESPHGKKPKFIWDLLYYNFVLDLTYRQYRRQLTRDGRNYPYEKIIGDLKEYKKFVDKLLPVENESHEKYFRKSMDYYILESYKRVDFMFKLIDALSSNEIAAIDRKHFLVNRFVPYVLVPLIQDGELHFIRKYKFYRPLFIIEDEILEEVAEIKELTSNALNYMYYENVLGKYQYVRAKAYELFKYHRKFRSNDYAEIKAFLRQCYNMRAYHQSNTLWNLIQDAEWKDMDEKTKSQVKEQIQHFLSINDAFFWKSSDRDYTIPKNE